MAYADENNRETRFPASGFIARSDSFLVDGLAATEEKIRELLGGDAPFVNELFDYAAGARGKRLRPRLTLLSGAGEETAAYLPDLAACAECIHLATLLHDDVIDEAPTRRGRPSAARQFGNQLSILGGDYLITRVFYHLTARVRDWRIMEAFLATTNKMVAGEFFEIWRQGRLDLTEDEYVHIITLKSAKMLETACEAGGLAAGRNEEQLQALRRFGLNVGISFQIVDDYLDYVQDAGVLGKEGYGDVHEGKVTLPLIYGLRSPAGPDIQRAVAAIWEGEPREKELGRMLEDCGAFESTLETARRFADKGRASLDSFPAGPAIELLRDSADWTWQRSF